MNYIKLFTDINIADAPIVGPKNGSLGQMIQHLSSSGVTVPLGFAITVDAYKAHLKDNNLIPVMKNILAQCDLYKDIACVQQAGKALREALYNAPLPTQIAQEIVQAYNDLSKLYNTDNLDVAVRSSATAEDLPGASFAGQLDTYLNIQGAAALLDAVKKCMASGLYRSGSRL